MVKGQPFEPDERMTKILVQAAEIGHAQLCVESFADRRDERVVWPGRSGSGQSSAPRMGLRRRKLQRPIRQGEWFYQAQVESPAMFARAPGAGSLYWAAAKDANGDYFDGSNTYKLRPTTCAGQTLLVPYPI